MKRTIKIILYFFSSILLIIALVLIFHNAIINFALKRVIESSSEGKVELKVGSFDFNLLTGSILITTPELLMNDLYLNESKNMTLDRVVFNTIAIDLLDLKHLVRNRNIIAEKFIIDKPVFWFTEQGTDARSSFHPDKLFEALNHNPGLFKMLKVKIGDIEIHYGSINIKEQNNTDSDPGLLDFTILLHDFNSEIKSDSVQKRILFSEELKFKLKNLKRRLNSGYTVQMDSAVFSTKKRDLEIAGAAFIPGEANLKENAVEVYAGKLTLNDIEIEEVRGLEDLNLRTIDVSDGYFTTFKNEESDQIKKSDTTGNLQSLEKLFYDFDLDSINISEFKYFHVDALTDTSIAVDNIQFLLTGIKIDSGMFDDPFRNFLYDTIKLSTGNFEMQQFVPGLELHYHQLTYSNKDRNLIVKGIVVNHDSSAHLPDNIDLTINELDIQGFSLKRFQKQQNQYLSIKVINPELDLDLVKFAKRTKTNKGKPFVPKYLQLENVELINGNLNMAVEKKFDAAIKGINISVEALNFPDQSDTSFSYQNLSFNFKSLIGRYDNRQINFVTGNFSFSDDELTLQNSSIIYLNKKSGNISKFRLKSIDLASFDLDRLIWWNEFMVDSVKLVDPVFEGILDLTTENSGQELQTSKPVALFPIKTKIGAIKLDGGNIKGVLNLDDEKIEIATSFKAGFGSVQLNKNDSLKVLIEQLLWDLDLTKSEFNYKDHKIVFDYLKTNSFKSNFELRNLTVGSILKNEDQSHNFRIRNLTIPDIKVNGLDYKLFMQDDSLKLSSIELENSSFDIILPEKTAGKAEFPEQKIEFEKYLFLAYDTISLKNIQGMLEQPGESSYRVYQFEGVHFNHVKNSSEELNLIKSLKLEFENFAYSDTVTNQTFGFNKGYLNSENTGFTIENIVWNNLPGNTTDSKTNRPEIDFKSSQLEFSDIFIKNDLPSHLKIGQVYIGKLDLYYKPAGKTSDTIPFNFNLEILRKYSQIMSRLQIDTTVLDKINIRVKNRNDNLSKQFEAENVALFVNKISLDTSMIGQKEPNPIESLTIDLRNRTDITTDSLYEIKTGRIHYNFPEHTATIDSVFVIPRYPDSVFFEKAIYQTDRLELFGRRIEVKNVDVRKLLHNNFYSIGSIDFHDVDLNMYRNKNYPFKPGIYKPLPREALMALNSKIAIDSVRFIKSFLNYKQLDSNELRPGEIYLTDFNLTAYNITNAIAADDYNSKIKVNLDAMILGETKMSFTLFFPLYKDSTAFWLSGETDDIDMVKLNQVTKNLMGIGITDGVGNVTVPLISGNDSIATGSLFFRYKKLRLALYNREKEELNSSFFSPVVNFFINDLVLRSNNPRFARRTKTGIVYFKRDTRKSIVNYTFKSILSGMLSTLGLNNKGQRKENKDLKKKY